MDAADNNCSFLKKQNYPHLWIIFEGKILLAAQTSTPGPPGGDFSAGKNFFALRRRAATTVRRKREGGSRGRSEFKGSIADLAFLAFAIGVLAGAIPLHMVLIHQVAAVSDAGFSKEIAALALGMIGLFTAPAMILMGLLADRIGRQRSYLLGSAGLMLGIFLLMAMDGADKSWLLYLFPPFIAVGFSSRQSLYPTLAADLFHGKSFGAIIGALSLFIGADAGIGPWLGGLIYDWAAIAKLSGSLRQRESRRLHLSGSPARAS